MPGRPRLAALAPGCALLPSHLLPHGTHLPLLPSSYKASHRARQRLGNALRREERTHLHPHHTAHTTHRYTPHTHHHATHPHPTHCTPRLAAGRAKHRTARFPLHRTWRQRIPWVDRSGRHSIRRTMAAKFVFHNARRLRLAATSISWRGSLAAMAQQANSLR